MFGGVCSENFAKSVVIVPITTFYGLMASISGLVVLAYLTNNVSHLLAIIALKRKQLENDSKISIELKKGLLGLTLVISQ